MSKNIKMNIDQDGIAVIEIDVQDRPMNVITVDFLKIALNKSLEMKQSLVQLSPQQKMISWLVLT